MPCEQMLRGYFGPTGWAQSLLGDSAASRAASVLPAPAESGAGAGAPLTPGPNKMVESSMSGPAADPSSPAGQLCTLAPAHSNGCKGVL